MATDKQDSRPEFESFVECSPEEGQREPGRDHVLLRRNLVGTILLKLHEGEEPHIDAGQGRFGWILFVGMEAYDDDQGHLPASRLPDLHEARQRK